MQEDSTNSDSPVVYSLTTQDTTFVLTKTREMALCSYTLFRTEHPKLFILETNRGDTPSNWKQISMENLDIFAYMNSKFVYIEKHIRQQMISLHHNVMQQKCELERQVITNALSFVTLQPDEFAYRLMKGLGYMAVTAGKAIFRIKCIPIDAIVRRPKKCYTELSITVRNTNMFLTPKFRILTKVRNQQECNHEMPTLYQIEDTWVQISPDPQVRQLQFQQLKPMAQLTWSYLTPRPLAVSGIYLEKDYENISCFPRKNQPCLTLLPEA